jgi:hypothetical protein
VLNKTSKCYERILFTKNSTASEIVCLKLSSDFQLISLYDRFENVILVDVTVQEVHSEI